MSSIPRLEAASISITSKEFCASTNGAFDITVAPLVSLWGFTNREYAVPSEDKIQAARRFYNGNVRDLNIKIESFPSNLIASLFNFQKMEFFGLADAAQKEPVQVKF